MFYEQLIALCAERGISPSAAAKAVGKTGAHITKWRKGSVPNDYTIQLFANYFGVAPDYFKTEKSPAQTDEGLDAKKALLMQLWDALDASGRSALLADATSLANNRKQKDNQ